MLRTAGLYLIAAAVSAVASRALAAETSWINPNGGLWSDAANWSDGVPDASDTVVLPDLRGSGYSIALGATNVCAVMRVEGTNVTLSNGTVQAGGAALIGVNGNTGELRLSDAVLVVSSVSIGTEGGNGVLDLEAGSAVLTGPLTVGVSASAPGSGLLAVDADSVAAATQVTLGAGSALELEAKFASGQRLLAQSVAANGSLTVVAHPSLSFPNIQVQLTTAPVTGSFAALTPPVVSGTPVPVTVSVGGIALQWELRDPITSLEVSVPAGTTYVGFEHPLTVIAVRMSGNTETVTSDVTFDFPIGEENATVVGTTLIPLNDQPFTVQATLEVDAVVVTGSLSLVAMSEPPISYHRIDVTSQGAPGNGYIPWDLSSQELGITPDMTPDGRFVAFVSTSSNLVVPDIPGENLFVKDLWTGEVERLDDNLPLASQSGLTLGSSISDDGRYVAYTKRLVSQDLTTMVWLHDRMTHTNTPMCMKPDGTVAAGQPGYARISADGSTVVYAVAAAGLIEGVPDTYYQIIAYDVATGVNTLVSATQDGVPANGESLLPSISCDGRYVAFQTGATNLVGGPVTIYKLVVHDRLTGANERIDVGPAGGGNGSAIEASISCDGRFVSFTSLATNLAASDTDPARDIFVRDRELGSTAHASPDLPGFALTAAFRRSMVSDDGAYVAYIGGNLPLPFGSEQPAHVLRSHVLTQTVDEVALTTWGEWIGGPNTQANGGRSWISSDGQRMVFLSDPSFLVPTNPIGVPYPNSKNGLFLRNFATAIPADLTGDGKVNAADLAILLGSWGASGSIADLDQDGVVGATDLAALLASWSV